MSAPTQAQIEAAAKGIPRATAYAEQIMENSGRFSGEVVNLAEQYLHFRDTAAAQVGDELDKKMREAIRRSSEPVAAPLTPYGEQLIERCAQVAESTTYMSGASIAAAIRKLKEE